MAERLAALGIKPPVKSGESVQQRQERETQERQERVRKAEAEDNKREVERQRRLADEKPTPPTAMSTSTKKPPPPPSRKSRADSAGQRVEATRESDTATAQLEAVQKAKEQALKDQQLAQEAHTKGIESESPRTTKVTYADSFPGMKPNAKRMSLPKSVKLLKHGLKH